jgi:N-acetylmuramic acid 6-phosphate etherase
LLIGITATGETSSILGSVMEATSRGSKAYIISCVDEACFKRLERSKLVFELPEVTVVDMPCEAMAIAGSTRMQSTTLEQLIAGASLELALKRILKERAPAFGGAGGSGDSPSFFYENFESLISALQSVQSVSAIAELIRFEEDVYKKKGLVTYFADDFLLDVISDTTERSPTFSLPPFRKRDDKISVPSWAFAKNLMLDTRSAWVKILGRAPRCIEWTKEDYIRMGAGKCILEKLPEIGAKELMKFMIGNEMDFSRIETPENAAVLISCGMDSFLREKFREHSQSYKKQKTLRVGVNENADFNIPYSAPETCLHLFEHLAVKLAMNLVSTGCMVKMGKVTGNWMTSLDISNKKLIDRGTRLISDLCSINYNEACLELFKSQEMLGHMNKQRTPISPVEYTIRRLKEPNGKAQNINGQESK